ncbi:hypothetical protein OG21DRAFT_372686 [Imleria badia]|nr:hypothetical protein OG21DRAFT_372686 [Imleria badia]
MPSHTTQHDLQNTLVIAAAYMQSLAVTQPAARNLKQPTAFKTRLRLWLNSSHRFSKISVINFVVSLSDHRPPSASSVNTGAALMAFTPFALFIFGFSSIPTDGLRARFKASRPSVMTGWFSFSGMSFMPGDGKGDQGI